MAIIRINYNNQIEELEFETRSEITSERFQKFLLLAKNNNLKLMCLCQKEPEYPEIIVSRLPNSHNSFTIKRNPHFQHKTDCIFHIGREEFYNEKTEKYKPTILQEAVVSKSNHTGERNIEETSIEQVRRYTYKHFCIDAYSDTIAHAFNTVNKGANLLTMYSINQYFSILLSKVLMKRLSNGLMAKEALLAYHQLSVGIIRDNLNDIQNNIITLYEYRQGDFNVKNVEISDECLEITRNLQNILGNILDGPYAYIAVYKSYFSNNEKRYKIVRIYTYAIVEHNDKFSFVESGLERDYAKRLMTMNIPFVKPINGHEYETIGNKYYPNGRPDLNYRPDFIEFHTNWVQVTEVCGFPDNEDYIKELNKKEVHYKQLEQDGTIRYYRHLCDKHP